ncbi:MAG: VOC family protein [Candidatus Staskawiczbacteria bacterium]|jgi:predicted enzyme related to lactoylglutathione lyase
MICGLAFVEIVVNDFDAMVNCYVQELGFKQGKADNNEDGRWCQLVTPDGQALIALWEPSDPLQKPDPAGRTRPCFLPIFKVRDICLLVNKLKTSGKIKILEEIRRRPKYWITTIADPEGNHLQLYEE